MDQSTTTEVGMDFSLDDKFMRDDGRIFLTGTQALVRLLLSQRARDHAAGLKTAGYVSGYRGSPLGGLDVALWRADRHLRENDIKFQPGLNEDLAATAIWGTQQAALFGPTKNDGVFSLWYGKGPGVDRSGDPLKHANLAGTSPNGGVLVVAGDDHGAKSSTTAHQSEQALVAAMLPILYPASIQEYIDFGLLGFAMSRYSGCWVSFKAVADIVEGSAVVDISPGRIQPVAPTTVLPLDAVHIRWPDSAIVAEERLINVKLPAVLDFARANGIDRVSHTAPQPRLGIVAAGKAWLDVCQAFEELGIDDDRRAALGLTVYKLGMVWPLEAEGLRDWAAGLDTVLVVEEKRNFIEDQVARALYDLPADRRPTLIGKFNQDGSTLVPAHGELDGVGVAEILVGEIERRGELAALGDSSVALEARTWGRNLTTAPVERTPWFCAGCPHNSSTRVPDGSIALAGIGCHTMATWMDRDVGAYTHMGGEGAAWIGMAPFTEREHVFQHIGDGTYAHSGLMAIRAAVTAGVNITYKILYNDAVAMTGGQPVEGQFLPDQISHQLAAEGVSTIAVVSDEPDKYPVGQQFAPGTTIHHRENLDDVQRTLRSVPGVTALIYDQTCAAEKRRRRKRGLFPDPAKRAFINERVCEGCGDCGQVSNCVAIHPLETEYGEKRVIDQSSCNKDYSCLDGFCPSFVSVIGGGFKGSGGIAARWRPIPDTPNLPTPEPYVRTSGSTNIVIAGIGGTGVVTIGALLGTAAHLDGLECTVLDQTGLAQKNGAVMSHVKTASDPSDINGPRVASGSADLLIGCDMVVAAGRQAMATLSGERSHAVINDHVVPIAAFAQNRDLVISGEPLAEALHGAISTDRAHMLNAAHLAVSLMGDAITANLMLVGYALQKGLLPVSLSALQQAIQINGVAIDENLRALAWGRLAAVDIAAVLDVVSDDQAALTEPVQSDVEDLIAARAAELTRYQNAAYANRYIELVDHVRRIESELLSGAEKLTRTIAQNLYKLMAYKDEYEVARLFTTDEFTKSVADRFEGRYHLRYHMAPPFLARRDPRTNIPAKMSFGSWLKPILGVLSGARWLRGTRFDPFGRTVERRLERQLIADYEALIQMVLANLSVANHDLALQLAMIPEEIRGYGHIKLNSVDQARQRQEQLMKAYLAAVEEKRSTG